MGINFSGKDAFVSQHFLDGSEIGPSLDKMSCKGVAEGMATGVFGYAGKHDCIADSTLDYGSVDVKPAFLLCFHIMPTSFLGEDPLPAPLAGGIGIFLCQSGW